jgi:hypothetical protein
MAKIKLYVILYIHKMDGVWGRDGR